MTASLLAGLTRFATGAQQRWVDCRRQARQRIYFANHTSHLDLMVLWAALPEEIRKSTRPVAAREYWLRGRWRAYLATSLFDAVLIPRPEGPLGGRAMIAPLLDALHGGSSLILFPEGTRGDGDTIGPFKSGLYHLCASIPTLEAVPVYLQNVNRILPKGEYLPLPLLSRVTFGAPLHPETGESKTEFLDRARAALCCLKEQ